MTELIINKSQLSIVIQSKMKENPRYFSIVNDQLDCNENSVKNVIPETADNISVTQEKARGFKCTCLDRILSRVQRGNTPSSGCSVYRQLAAVSAMSIGCLLDGCVLAYSSPALPSLEKDSSIELNDAILSWIGSAHSLGAIFGCLLSIPSLEVLGRRGAALYVMSLAYIIGFLLIGLATFPWLIILGRLCGGIGLGLTLSITPVYLVEVTSLELRGVLGVVPPLLAQVGVLYTYVVGCYMDWRLLSLSGVSLTLLFIFCVWFIPESPVYLASKAKFEAAEESLAWLGRKNDSVKFFKEVQTDMNVFDITLAASWRQYIDPRVYKPFLSCLAIMFFFQATGYNTIIAYSLSIFHESGPKMSDNVAMGIKGSIILLSAIIALGLARICSRKVLLLSSCLGISSTLAVLGSYYYSRQFSSLESLSFVPLLLLVITIFFFMIGFGALAWTVMAELMPAKVRSKLYPWLVAFTWLVNFGFNKSFPYLQTLIGLHGTFWGYSVITFLGAGFIFFRIPETKNRTPEDIAAFFNTSSLSSLSGSSEAVIDKTEDVV